MYKLRNLIFDCVNIDKIIVFLATWALVSIALLILSIVFKSQVVFGNMDIAGTMSAVVWSFVLTYLGKIAPQVLSRLELKVKDERYAMVVTTILLIPVIWLLKRLAVFTGVGISNNFFVLVVAIVASIVTFYSFKYSEHYLKKLQ